MMCIVGATVSEITSGKPREQFSLVLLVCFLAAGFSITASVDCRNPYLNF